MDISAYVIYIAILKHGARINDPENFKNITWIIICKTFCGISYGILEELWNETMSFYTSIKGK